MPRRAEPQPTAEPKPVPPIGVKVSTDMERRSYGIRARARWTDPTTKRRVIRSEIVRDEAAAHAADIKTSLKRAGTPIGAHDTLIAGHARSRGLLLLTGNLGEFQRVPGLRCQDWTESLT